MNTKTPEDRRNLAALARRRADFYHALKSSRTRSIGKPTTLL